MGYYRGWVDEVLSRVIEALLSIPVILVALLIISVLGSSRVVVIGTVVLLFTPIVTRTIRAAVLAEAQLDYVTSAKLRGESGLFVMSRTPATGAESRDTNECRDRWASAGPGFGRHNGRHDGE